MKAHDKDEPFTFVLFPNPKKLSADDGKPKWVGKIILEDGTAMRLAGWQNKMTNANGDYIGGKMSTFMTKEQVAAKLEEKKQEDDDINLPF